jgi:hypothetical protein
MYCSSCGVAVTQGLSYCNYCGAKLSTAVDDNASRIPEVRPELLVAAMVGTFIFGLAAIIVLMGVMKTVLDAPPEAIVAATLVCLLIMLFLEGVILRLLFRRPLRSKKPDNSANPKGSPTKELDGTQPRSLPEPVSSVTEHTTRAFDPLYVERQKQ